MSGIDAIAVGEDSQDGQELTNRNASRNEGNTQPKNLQGFTCE